jgi:hypothetical protein
VILSKFRIFRFTQSVSAFGFCPVPGHWLLWLFVPDQLLRQFCLTRFCPGPGTMDSKLMFCLERVLEEQQMADS